MTGIDQPTVRAGAILRELAEPTGPLPAGARVGQYVVVATLGQGRYGVTYRARDPRLHADVAIKEFLPLTLARRHGRRVVTPLSEHTQALFQWGRGQFLDEARKLSVLGVAETPAIVARDVFEDNGTAYLVMALLRGESLEARLKREHRLSRQAIDRLLPPLLDSLAAAHANGLLHGDIQPAHVLVDLAGRPSLVDFGAARLALADRVRSETGAPTDGFAAPEQLACAPLGTWTDIYGLAGTLYQCVAGAKPLSASERLARDPLVPAAEIGRRGYGPELLAAIDAGLRPVAADRPQTVAAWRAILATPPSQPASVEAPSQPAAPADRAASSRVIFLERRRRVTAVAAIAGALVATAIGVAPLLGPGGDSSTPVRRGTLADIPVPTIPPAAVGRPATDSTRDGGGEQADAAKKQASAEAARNEATRQAEEARRLAQAEAKRREEAEAARQAAEEAKRQAQAEAKRREEAEAARHAAEEAKRQAQAEAKRREEAEAARQAAEEAKRQAQAEAKRREEAEAARQAAETARQQAMAAEARRQADEAARRAAQLQRQREAVAAAARQAEEEATRQAAEAKRRAEADAARRVAAEKAAAEMAAAEKAAAEKAAAEKAAAEKAAEEKAAAEAAPQAEEQTRLQAEARRKAQAEAAAREAQEKARLKAEVGRYAEAESRQVDA
ncbi:MAG TPA: hypothetical protein VJ890_18255, partial [Vineibacter sp.]|nr:hypothetical protein [Vineibacter sp.]